MPLYNAIGNSVSNGQLRAAQDGKGECCTVEYIIANCRNVRALGRVPYIDYITSLNISTEMLMNEKLPSQV